MFCCTLLYVHSSIAIILMGKRKLVALLNLSSWCLLMVERLFFAVPRGCLWYVIVVFPDHTRLLFLSLFCYALLCVYFSFTIILKRKRKLVALLLLYCYSVALPHGAVGWSAVCDYGIS